MLRAGFVPISDVREREAPSGLEAPVYTKPEIDRERLESLRDFLHDGCTPEDIVRIGGYLDAACGQRLAAVWDGRDQHGMTGDVNIMLQDDEGFRVIPPALWMLLQDFEEQRPETDDVIEELEDLLPTELWVADLVHYEGDLVQYDACNWHYPDE